MELVPLLGAKLLPPTPAPTHLTRPRLHERMAAGLEGRATVILAGPGYGKTSLAARFIQDLGGDSVWYSLDAADRDPWMFFRYLVHGIREHAPEFGDRIEGIWKDPRPPSDEVERLVDILVSEVRGVAVSRRPTFAPTAPGPATVAGSSCNARGRQRRSVDSDMSTRRETRTRCHCKRRIFRAQFGS